MKKSFWSLLMQVPLLGVGVVFKNNWRENPWAALGFFILYELIWFLCIFGSKVWKILEPEILSKTAEWVKTAFLNCFSAFRRRYNRQAFYDHRVFNVRGLKTTGTYTLLVILLV